MDNFEKRLEELRKKFFSEAKLQVGGDPNDAEDLLQEVTLVLWQQRDRVYPDRIEGLFRKVLQRRGSNWRRSRLAKKNILSQAISLDQPASYDISEALEPEESRGTAERFSDKIRETWQPSAEEVALDNWESESLFQLFQSLPEHERETLEAFHGTGQGIRQISLYQNTPDGTVKCRLARGRDRLMAKAQKAKLG